MPSLDLMLLLALAGYTVSVAVFLVLENRKPQSTVAWLFLLLAFPVGGLVIYHLFGRGRHAFSREGALTPLIAGSTLARRSRALVDDQPARLAALEAAHGEYARLAAMLWTTARAPLTRCPRVEILQDAAEKYPRLLDDLRAATGSIHLLYYEWADDAFTRDVADLLAQKRRDGVEVRILYDPVGSFFMLSRRHVRRMRRAGIRMLPFSSLWHLHTLSYRNHRKIAVIDGRIGYSGGLNMTGKHLTGPEGFSGWRDTHARVTGDPVPVLQAVFATMWHNSTGENLFEERYFPEADADGAVPVQVLSAGPDSQWEAIRHCYLAMFAMAHDHVYIQSPFLILDTSLAEAMKTAALGGIDVRVMIAPRGAELSPAYRAGFTYAADMARAGVRIHLYEGPYFHAKTACVDGVVCAIGSANMDIRSFSINYETNLVVFDAGTTRELEAAFARDLERCVPFSAEAYARRPWVSRLADSTLRLLSPLL